MELTLMLLDICLARYKTLYMQMWYIDLGTLKTGFPAHVGTGSAVVWIQTTGTGLPQLRAAIANKWACLSSAGTKSIGCLCESKIKGESQTYDRTVSLIVQ